MSKRIDIQKTYKLFIDGKFPRTESGRYIKWTDSNNTTVVNICRGSRKDFRNAMVSARKASRELGLVAQHIIVHKFYIELVKY